MITKQQFSAEIASELYIIKHLFSKIPEGAWDYRPTDKQRNTLELVQYIALIVGTAMEMLAGKADAFADFENQKSAVTPDNFVSIVDAEEQKIAELLSKFDEETLAKEIDSWGRTAPLSIHLLGLLKILAAYKMQLFLYIKANGVENIGTSNLWGGRDM